MLACSEFRGNPKKDLRKLYKDHYTIKREIEILRPNLVWLPTAPAYDGLLQQALSLPEDSFVDIGCRGKARVCGLEKLMDPGRSIALRTYYPQAGIFKVRSLVNRIREAGI